MPNRPTLLIVTRFGLGVSETSWFEHRLTLMEAVTAPSLAAQTDQNFRWAVFVDPEIDPSIRAKLQSVVSTVPGGSVVDHVRYKTREVAEFAEHLGLAHEGRILTGRLDDDDAIERTTVEKLYGLADRWLAAAKPKNGLALTFRRGFEWIMYDMVDVLKEQKWQAASPRQQGLRRYDYPFLGTSVFVLAPVEEHLTSIAMAHSSFRELVEARGLDCIIDETPDMWLYARHKQTDSTLQKSKDGLLPVDYDELHARFGIDVERVRAYVDRADEIPYVVEKKAMRRRGDLIGEIKRLEKALKAPDLTAEQAAALQGEMAGFQAELDKLRGGLTGEYQPQPPRPAPGAVYPGVGFKASDTLLCWTSEGADEGFRRGVKVGPAAQAGDWSEGWEHTIRVFDRENPLKETVAGRLLRLAATLVVRDGVDAGDLFRELSQVREFDAALHPAPRPD